VTDPIQDQHAAVVHVEVGFDALGLGIRVFEEAAAHLRQLDCGQVQGAERPAGNTTGGSMKPRVS